MFTKDQVDSFKFNAYEMQQFLKGYRLIDGTYYEVCGECEGEIDENEPTVVSARGVVYHHACRN